MTVALTAAEREYLQTQPLARLATVDANGAPQNSPVGAFFDEATGDILIGGGAMGATRKFHNVQGNAQVALVVDDLVSRDPWTVRGLEIRGTAVALDDVEPPVPPVLPEAPEPEVPEPLVGPVGSVGPVGVVGGGVGLAEGASRASSAVPFGDPSPVQASQPGPAL